MIFGKIDYLNLLPFHIFLKKYSLPSYVKKTIEFKKGVPSLLNRALYNRKIDAAVISSIESRRSKYKKLNMGIVAKTSVKSVLVRKNSTPKLDSASMTSNMLARVLDKKGEVIIGDRALKHYLNEGKDKFYDLGEIWHQKTNLPFVFAVFCYTNSGESYKKLVNKFLQKNIKIPSYILNKYAKTRGISSDDIKWYLKFISYKIGQKESLALNLYIRKARQLNFNPNTKENT
ncbi:MqnA/MqnD/SBP family protein [Campylobacter geochelonis]|uniref:Chorismate dehydratase n=1 Tax=Campylobacter geochelonis TaxID=1780362 RepID=A0A128EBJ8_9BACT|nr:MqnA/MqnD/SBP family protein [Campylobacter geochelonis]QKF72072.1 6-amino-6-deoxyfutalosine synthase [Campylobacter geochelonis]CZE45847.1 Menaquinone via futalosine step 1 [Campylobacter geochelonis]CZE46790.1 Menaquinone via futalosine step 1 [Campylobacter geochelonis]CZE49839.1 Menaquinone via futalosine step 1 [Campylobacter geochelonis]